MANKVKVPLESIWFRSLTPSSVVPSSWGSNTLHLNSNAGRKRYGPRHASSRSFSWWGGKVLAANSVHSSSGLAGVSAAPHRRWVSCRNTPFRSSSSSIRTSFSSRWMSTDSDVNHPNEIKRPVAVAPQQVAAAFRKVLIANRGEISVRVARTCRRLGISTVAVYASEDSKSKHVSEADEALCLGRGAEAYTDLRVLRQAIVATGADAVHPGYGFLSENADFCEAVQGLRTPGGAPVTWLGPPATAIRDMGCKLLSKGIAREAGVAVKQYLPGSGSDGSLRSLDEALELMRNNATRALDYPILLKAAGGGGGKGMRVCHDERELAEGYPLAESEGFKFFADGRLMLEQYLEDPHHIEFQVVCSKHESEDGGAVVDVAIFAERECSIQRRNQKVVEESPSCLLTATTRRKMMEQTARLCQKVGYEGAGTVEWLVVDDDEPGGGSSGEEQTFCFLEMNTRLQVEHPVTEAVSGNVDLVEAMLEVGCGRGLPREWYHSAEVVELGTGCGREGGGGKMLIMPWEGHSIEGRIYAEDPLRGYLPSTGPLVPYKEPPKAFSVDDGSREHRPILGESSYLRLDSGVVEGHVVTPFYDPMLSKIISFAPTRDEAIRVLSDGLDSYVIEGVRHNAKLVRAVLRHPAFRKGKTPVSFLEREIPNFAEYRYHSADEISGDAAAATAPEGSLLSASEEEELAVAVAVITRSREILLGQSPVVDVGEKDQQAVMIRLDGLFGKSDAFSVTVQANPDSSHQGHEARVERRVLGGEVACKNGDNGRVIAVGNVDLDLEGRLARVTLDGTERIIQVLREMPSGELKIQMCGAEYPNCLVQSPDEYRLSSHMLPPPVEDTGNCVLSPMPGTLISFSEGLAEGDHVNEGQELCVVEAMKMQNVIRSPREGILSKFCVNEGAALVTDQVILEFEAENCEDTPGF